MMVLRAPFTTRSWAEFLYALAGLPLGAFGFVFSICSVTAGVLLLGTFFGLPLIALALLAARAIGAAHRALARRLLGFRVDAPAPMPSGGRGFFGWLSSVLRDAAGWRAYAYLVLKFPLALVGFARPVAPPWTPRW